MVLQLLYPITRLDNATWPSKLKHSMHVELMLSCWCCWCTVARQRARYRGDPAAPQDAERRQLLSGQPGRCRPVRWSILRSAQPLALPLTALARRMGSYISRIHFVKFLQLTGESTIDIRSSDRVSIQRTLRGKGIKKKIWLSLINCGIYILKLRGKAHISTDFAWKLIKYVKFW